MKLTAVEGHYDISNAILWSRDVFLFSKESKKFFLRSTVFEDRLYDLASLSMEKSLIGEPADFNHNVIDNCLTQK